MPKRVKRSTSDLDRQLQEQLGFLATSCRLFDEGQRSEAKRLAGTLRTLLYDGGRSRSLLGQLGLLGLGFVNTNAAFDEHNLLSHHGLLLLRVDSSRGSSLEPRVLGPPSIVPGHMPFRVWWEDDVILVDTERTTITRRDVVLVVANQDGGSHVDPALDAAYHALSRGQSIGWMAQTPMGPQPIGDPTLPSLRQIAYEVIETLAQRRQLSPFHRRDRWFPTRVQGG